MDTSQEESEPSFKAKSVTQSLLLFLCSTMPPHSPSSLHGHPSITSQAQAPGGKGSAVPRTLLIHTTRLDTKVFTGVCIEITDRKH